MDGGALCLGAPRVDCYAEGDYLTLMQYLCLGAPRVDCYGIIHPDVAYDLIFASVLPAWIATSLCFCCYVIQNFASVLPAWIATRKQRRAV